MPVLHSVQLYINAYIQISNGVLLQNSLQIKLIYRGALSICTLAHAMQAWVSVTGSPPGDPL